MDERHDVFTNEDLEWQVQADRSIEEQEDLGFFVSPFDGDPKISAQKSVEDVNISDSVILTMHMHHCTTIATKYKEFFHVNRMSYLYVYVGYSDRLHVNR